MDEDLNLEETIEPEEEVELPSLSCEMRCIFRDSNGQPYEDFYGKSDLYSKKLTLYDSVDSPLELGYEEILDFSGGDYQIMLPIESGEQIILKELGYNFEDFLGRFIRLRNEFLAIHMLMDDTKIFEVDGEYESFNEMTEERSCGECTARVYEKSLVVMSFKEGPIRIPLSLVDSISREEYSLTIKTDYFETFVLKYMGENLDIFEKKLNAAMGKLSSNMQEVIRSLAPKANSMILRRASNLLKDGRAVSMTQLESDFPMIQKALEEKMGESGSRPDYEFLKSIAVTSKIHIGLKRGLIGGLNSDYIWMMAPLAVSENTIVMEAIGASGEGKATYFFRIMPWENFLSCDRDSLEYKTLNMLKILNKSMVFIDFRREPIYMSQDKFNKPENLRYKIALQRLPCLNVLRTHFIGRVIHSNSEQWKRDIESLVEGVNSSRDDSYKWKKGNK